MSEVEKVLFDIHDSLGMGAGKPAPSESAVSSMVVARALGTTMLSFSDESFESNPASKALSAPNTNMEPISALGNSPGVVAMQNPPPHIQAALSLPPAPPNLGNLVVNSISYSTFFRSYRRLGGLDWNSDRAPNIDRDREREPLDSYEPRQFRPQGILVSTLCEHSKAVTRIVVSRDNLFMASGSDDSTIKIWDCERLRNSPSASSHLTYSQLSGRITALALCESSHAVAAASESGALHVVKVEYMSKEASNTSNSASPSTAGQPKRRCVGFSEVRKIDANHEGSVLAIDHFNTVSESLLVYATKRGFIHGWDLRSKEESFNMQVLTL